ncbi:MAG: glycosyltransferase family 2 protein [Lachnospiraceae bacterium]|nr:glycosyltransferase family 2 protein [Lachnospiraceae bacterium]MBR4174370.1 glycosyltransferase family 2 protein [Lachnospiraceae bacterium]
MMDVSVIIPNYNGKKYIKDCITSLKEQTIADRMEIILVDNASEDGSSLMALEADERVIVLPLDDNYGFSRAVNEGIKLAKAPFVLLINNDTKAMPDMAENLLNAIKQDDNIFSVASKMIQMDDPARLDGAGDLYSAFGWAYARGKDKSVKLRKYEKPCEIFAACGGCAIYRKSILDEIGYFDEYHFAYLEDVDMGYRARIMGYKNVYCPKAVVYHAGSGASGSRYNDFKVRLSARNNVYIVFKNMPLLQLILNLPLLIIGFGIKALFFIVKGYGRPYLSGIKRGYLLCHEGLHVNYDSRNFKNYVRIQFDIWAGMFKRLVN